MSDGIGETAGPCRAVRRGPAWNNANGSDAMGDKFDLTDDVVELAARCAWDADETRCFFHEAVPLERAKWCRMVRAGLLASGAFAEPPLATAGLRIAKTYEDEHMSDTGWLAAAIDKALADRPADPQPPGPSNELTVLYVSRNMTPADVAKRGTGNDKAALAWLERKLEHVGWRGIDGRPYNPGDTLGRMAARLFDAP